MPVVHAYEGYCGGYEGCVPFFLHRPYLLHMGLEGGLGGKIGFMSVVFHSLCVVCGWLMIGDRVRGIDGMMAVGDCRVSLRGLWGCRVTLCGMCGVRIVW